MDIEALQRLIGGPRDGALLRYTLGRLLLKADDLDGAIRHLSRAVDWEPGYTAAWKELGRALAVADRKQDAAEAYRRGIEAARSGGDVQAEKEMGVFLKRVTRELGNQVTR